MRRDMRDELQMFRYSSVRPSVRIGTALTNNVLNSKSHRHSSHTRISNLEFLTRQRTDSPGEALELGPAPMEVLGFDSWSFRSISWACGNSPSRRNRSRHK